MPGDANGPAVVLVAEDAVIPRLALARGVEQEGHRVLVATDGREALEVLARERVDMVLLDLVMPELDGFAVLRAMRADPDLADIPVLVISATEATDEVARAIEMGAIDCLPKPFEPALLRVRMRTALEQTRLRRLEQDYLRQELALRQQERLAVLGRLSAGLGHELNNPAAAALSTARQLQRALDDTNALLPRLLARADGARVVDAVAELLDQAPAGPADGTRDELTDSIEDVLTARGVAEPWTVAAELADVGIPPGPLAGLLDDVGDGAQLAVEWLRTRSRVRRGVTHITRSIERIADLTAALRGYSYLDQAPQQDVDVRRGLDDTLMILSHKARDDITVIREYSPHLPTIHAYGGQLNQVWTNLIDNAFDAVGDHGAVIVRAEADGDGVCVQVEDDGPGIPEGLRGQVFDPFVTTKPPGQGTGLGLAISYQIVTDTHGGRMTVHSEPGRTVFDVRLPAAPPPGATDGH
ncbi:MAG TPA: hybrid sensor histidine kinase/response regulator [Euzebyales bacterium]|nr:hybrid sensor histidine kinase/response regulator [Euzebyales bacterium]